MKEGEEGLSPIPEVGDLAEALQLMKLDTSNLLKDMLRGISMWGMTAVVAFLMAGAWLALAQAILTYAHPYGSYPLVLDTLYAGYALSAVSACAGVFKRLCRFMETEAPSVPRIRNEFGSKRRPPGKADARQRI